MFPSPSWACIRENLAQRLNRGWGCGGAEVASEQRVAVALELGVAVEPGVALVESRVETEQRPSQDADLNSKIDISRKGKL
jgi:hypothetical protein